MGLTTEHRGRGPKVFCAWYRTITQHVLEPTIAAVKQPQQLKGHCIEFGVV